MVSIIGHAERSPIMPVTLPHSVKKLLQDKAYGHVLTFNAQGKPQVTETGADDHIDKLAKRFLNADKYPFRRPGEKRLIVRISVDRIGGFGPKMGPWA